MYSSEQKKTLETNVIVYLQNKGEHRVERTKGMKERKSHSSEYTFLYRFEFQKHVNVSHTQKTNK